MKRIKFTLSSIKSFVWRAAFCLLVLCLITSHFSAGFAAKFTSGTTGSDAARVANFSYSAKIDGVSALSFTNTAFWGGTVEEDKIAMNALRSLDFTVNNFKVTTDEGGNERKVVCEVATAYDLQFSAPSNFVEKLAFQLFEIGQDSDTETVMLPQIVISDLFDVAKTEGVSYDYNTADSTDYNAEATTDLTFSVVKTTTGGNSAYTATCGNVVLTFEPVIQKMEQTLYFRLWDVSNLTKDEEGQRTVSEEGGTLLAPLEVTYEADVLCYKIGIDFGDEFVFPAGVETTHRYSVRLAPTATISDDYLGGALLAENGAAITSLAAGQTVQSKVIQETITDTPTNENGEALEGQNSIVTTKTVLGNPTVYEAGKTVSSDPYTFTTVEEQDPTEPEVVNTENIETINSFVADAESTIGEYILTEGGGNNRYKVYSVTKNGTQTIIRNDTIEQYHTTKTTTTSVNESINTKEILLDDKDGDIIKQMVTKSINISESNSTITIRRIDKVTTETPISISGTVRIYMNGNKENVYSWDNSTITSSGDARETGREKGESTTTGPVTETSEPRTTTEYFSRTIERSTKFSPNFTIKSVSRRVKTGTGDNATYTTEYYTADNPFKLMGNDNLQKFFVSQCYSKNYPLAVNVKIDQIN